MLHVIMRDYKEMNALFTVLIVEDDPSTRRLMETVIRQNGFEPVTAENGAAALELLDSKQVDVVVLDIMMPKMDGYEFTRTLRAGDCTLPILMVSAKESIDAKRQGFLIGVDDYMVKPVNTEELIMRINALMRRSKIVTDRSLTIGGTTFRYDELSVTSDGVTEALALKGIFYRL